MSNDAVLVEVVDTTNGRQINWNVNLAERLGGRVADLREGIASGVAAVIDGLPSLDAAEGWRLGELSATFGISLTAEAGVILSKAEAGATFEISVTFSRSDST